MRLTGLEIRDVRSLERASLAPAPGFNILVGANGAGKTAILEAIHILATGRSFAATRTARLIRTGGGPLRVTGQIRSEHGGTHRVGLERASTGPARMRMDGAPAQRVAELARQLPLVAIHPESHNLIRGGPGERRRLLDLGLFHVEPAFHGLWQRYRRALAQRNVLLRRGAGENEVRIWEGELARTGHQLDELRQRYVADLALEVRALAQGILGTDQTLDLQYRRGWGEGETLGEALGRLRSREVEQRVTGVGPHRAELVLRLDDRDVRQRVSRGQQKLLVYVLRLAQARQLGAAGDGQCVLLLDDLPAELDAEHRARIMAVAADVRAQCFVTALAADSLPPPEARSPQLFHVERGCVTEMVQ
jgi:DNA replication and repair protein RecF